jgi:hypothetical protein
VLDGTEVGVELGAIDTDGVLDGTEDKLGAGDTVGTTNCGM